MATESPKHSAASPGRRLHSNTARQETITQGNYESFDDFITQYENFDVAAPVDDYQYQIPVPANFDQYYPQQDFDQIPQPEYVQPAPEGQFDDLGFVGGPYDPQLSQFAPIPQYTDPLGGATDYDNSFWAPADPIYNIGVPPAHIDCLDQRTRQASVNLLEGNSRFSIPDGNLQAFNVYQGTYYNPGPAPAHPTSLNSPYYVKPPRPVDPRLIDPRLFGEADADSIPCPPSPRTLPSGRSPQYNPHKRNRSLVDNLDDDSYLPRKKLQTEAVPHSVNPRKRSNEFDDFDQSRRKKPRADAPHSPYSLSLHSRAGRSVVSSDPSADLSPGERAMLRDSRRIRKKHSGVVNYALEKPKTDNKRHWIRKNAQTQGLTTRTGKINQYKDDYENLPHPIGEWASSHYKFKYTDDGEFEQKTMSARQIEQFILQYPKDNKYARLKLWIQVSPTDSARRYNSQSWSKCRFRDCPVQREQVGTILHGHFRVSFDEKWHRHRENANPFLTAGYVHLYCMERFLDFPKICKEADVEVDTRQLTSEPKQKFAATLYGHGACGIAQDFVRYASKGQLHRLTEFAQYPKHENHPKGAPKYYYDTLNYHMTVATTECRATAQIKQFTGKKLQWSHMIVHAGDLEVMLKNAARDKARKKAKKQGKKSGKRQDESSDSEEGDILTLMSPRMKARVEGILQRVAAPGGSVEPAKKRPEKKYAEKKHPSKKQSTKKHAKLNSDGDSDEDDFSVHDEHSDDEGPPLSRPSPASRSQPARRESVRLRQSPRLRQNPRLHSQASSHQQISPRQPVYPDQAVYPPQQPYPYQQTSTHPQPPSHQYPDPSNPDPYSDFSTYPDLPDFPDLVPVQPNGQPTDNIWDPNTQLDTTFPDDLFAGFGQDAPIEWDDSFNLPLNRRISSAFSMASRRRSSGFTPRQYSLRRNSQKRAETETGKEGETRQRRVSFADPTTHVYELGSPPLARGRRSSARLAEMAAKR